MSKIKKNGDELLLTVYEGEDFVPNMVYTISGVPQDISGFVINANLKLKRDDVDVIETFDCSLVDAPNGVFNFKLTKSQILSLTKQYYYFDLFANDGTYSYHWLSGTLAKKETTE